MQNDNVLRNMPADTKFFVYQEATLAYSPETGMCWRVDKRDGNWNLIIPGASNGKYTQLGVGTNVLQLHRIIAEVFLNSGKPLTAQQKVDHIKHADGSHYQDRLENLRICSNSENIRNCRLSSRNTSGYKGVCWNKPTSKWRARIRISGKLLHLGFFHTPEDAAEAYDAAAIRYFGEFSLTNAKLGNFKPRKPSLGLMQVF